MGDVNDFLPPDYEVPTDNHYLKFQAGDNKFRILSKPIIGFEDWKDKKPLRFHMKDKPSCPIDPKQPIKHFWAMVVWSYDQEKVLILEITQGGIQKKIKALAADADWGDPMSYDIKVTKSGSGMDTEYEVKPIPHKPVADNIKAAYGVLTIDLNQLFTGGDPFNPQPHIGEINAF